MRLLTSWRRLCALAVLLLILSIGAVSAASLYIDLFPNTGSPATTDRLLTETGSMGGPYMSRTIAQVLGLITSSNVTTALGFTPLNAGANLSDLPSAATARANLGLGSLATASSLNDIDASGADVTDLNGGNVATIASRAGETLDVIAGFGASPAATGNDTDGTISASSTTFTSASADFTAAAVGDDIWVDGVGARGFPLDTTIASVGSTTSITLAAASSLPSGGRYVQSALVSAPGTGCVPGNVETVTTSATLAAQLTITACGVFTTPTVAAAGSGGTDNITCVVTGSSSDGSATAPYFGPFEAVVTTNSSGELASVVSVLTHGTYTTDPTDPAAEPVTSETCGNLTGAQLDLTLGVETVNPTVRGSYTSAPSGAQPVTSSGSTSGDTYVLTTGIAGNYVYGHDSANALANAIASANSAFAADGQPQSIALPAGNYIIDHCTASACVDGSLPQFTNGVAIRGAGWYRSRLFVGPAYTGSLFAVNNAAINFGPAVGAGNTFSANDVSSGPTFQNFVVLGDLDDQNTVTAFDLIGTTGNVLIQNVEVRPLVGGCLYVGDLGGNDTAYIRESRISNLQCKNTGTPLTPAEIFTSQTSVNTDSTNEWYISTRAFGSMGPGVVIASRDTYKTTTYLQFISLSSEQAGQANPVADAVDVGTAGDTGGVSVVHIENLDVPTVRSTYGCALRLGGSSTSATSYAIQVATGDIGTTPYGVCYENVRSTSVHLDALGGTTAGVVIGPEMGTDNYLTAIGSADVAIASYNLLPARLLFSEPGVESDPESVRQPGFTYGPDYGGTLVGAAIASTSGLYGERFSAGAVAVLRSISFDVTTANSAAWNAEVCVYRDQEGRAAALLLDTGSIAVSANATGVQTYALPTPLALAGPASYTIALMASSTGESLLSAQPTGTLTSPTSAGSLRVAGNVWGAGSAATLFAGSAPAGGVASATFGSCPATPSFFSTAGTDVPYVALGF